MIKSRSTRRVSDRGDPTPPGMLTHDQLFVASMPGADPATGKIPDDPASQVDTALDRVEAVVKAAGLELKKWFSSIRI